MRQGASPPQQPNGSGGWGSSRRRNAAGELVDVESRGIAKGEYDENGWGHHSLVGLDPLL